MEALPANNAKLALETLWNKFFSFPVALQYPFSMALRVHPPCIS